MSPVAKALAECKKLAKGGHASSSKILAKQIVQTRKSIERMYTAKAQMNSIAMQLQTTAGDKRLRSSLRLKYHKSKRLLL